MSHYIIKTATAQMPSSIEATWEKLHVGSTEACAYRKALAEAQAVCDELNGGAK